MKIDAGTQSLPEYVIRDILRRIDVKSLILFQCVSKQWKTLINAPSFIAEHLRRQSPCLLFRGETHRNLQLGLLDREMQAREMQVQPSVFELESPKIVGSSNGLLCLQIKKELHLSTLLLWNPAIRELRMIPRVGGYCSWSSVGFGFSPIINDYKVLMIRKTDHYNRTLHMDVYSLTSGSWKSIDNNILEGIRVKGTNVTANGVMFWHVGNDDANMILSFDIALEVLTLIPFPVIANHYFCFRLAVYENKLAMLVENHSWNPEPIALWVMDKGDEACSYGEGWSWAKRCNAAIPCHVNPLMIWKSEIVCEVSENGKRRIALFNVTTSEFHMIDMHDSEFIGFMRGFECIDYVESLVPVGGKKLYATFA
ncbi:unnamed protein product [Cuscuta campestris]|uniref:F-box domain-containing protein n=1 Tax=Cuscuta campestris TaxID=132261 RepID=A0A484K9J7_9ASTE|nr:unnamed protein product [Cuscuta campestris]